MILFRLILIVGMLAISTLSVAQEKPNIVFIMADDLGLGDVSYYNEAIQKTDAIVKTPAIDSLAEQGIWFNDAHSATSLCSPTRYCVMSGNMNYRSYAKWGVWGTFRESPFRPGEATLASVPKSAGYSTAFIGKWHLGGDFRNKKDGSIFRHHGKLRSDHSVDVSEMVGGGPASLGFDYSLTIPCGIQGPVYTVYENGKWLPANDESKLVFLTEKNAIHPKIVSDKGPGPGDSHFDTREIGKLISQKASDFIERQNGSKPFFLCYWSPHVHLPHFPTDEFDGKKIANQTPSRHLDTLLDLDQQVARIISSLKKANQFDNTLIILTSDNGGLSPKATLKSGHDPSGGYRGFKNSAFEGGHRVPYIATWPGHIQPGTFCNEPIINQDSLATFADLLNVALPETEAMDSLSLLPLLTQEGQYQSRDFFMMQAGSKHEIMFRENGWKLILQSNREVSKFEPIGLFNLNSNPTENESENLVKDPDQLERIKSMREKYIRIRENGARTTPIIQG